MCIIEGMSNLTDVIASLEHLAPLRLAADWDNVGLLVATKKTCHTPRHDLPDAHQRYCS